LQSLEKNACGCLQQTSNRIIQWVIDHRTILQNSQLTTTQITNRYGRTPSRWLPDSCRSSKKREEVERDVPSWLQNAEQKSLGGDVASQGHGAKLPYQIKKIANRNIKNYMVLKEEMILYRLTLQRTIEESTN
jgi:hypothetical protein